MPSTLKLQTNIYEAKTKLSQLVDRAMKGEVVIIAKAGRPMVKLVRVETPDERILGSAAGRIKYAEGWDAPMTESELNEMVSG
jgi:prevent-host-death family protein